MGSDAIHVGGVRLEAAWFGAEHAAGADLVLLHEGLGCVELWRDVPERLAALTGRRVFAYSRRGYGTSDPCDLPRPVTFMHTEGLDVLPGVLDAAGIENCVLIGHSDGGSIALIHAGGVKDPRVEGVVTIAAHVFNEDVCVASIEAAKTAFETTDLREKLARYHGENVDCAFRGWNEVWLDPDFRAWNIEEFLPSIDVPVLAMQGTEDEYGSESQVDAIVAGVSGPARKRMIAGAKHSPHLQAKDETLGAIAEFLTEG
jgi:pimeloyl-ACP methyl ester carboxylesterase